MPNVFFDVTDAIDVIEWPGRVFSTLVSSVTSI